MVNSVDPDEMAHYELSSGSTLFAKESVLVCTDERINSLDESLHDVSDHRVDKRCIQISFFFFFFFKEKNKNLGPAVQSVVSLTSSFRVISLTVLADSIYNILIFFAEKM